VAPATPAPLQRALLPGCGLFILFDVEAVFMMPWRWSTASCRTHGVGRFFGFWEMWSTWLVAVGLYYIVRKGVLNWSQDKRIFKMTTQHTSGQAASSKGCQIIR